MWPGGGLGRIVSFSDPGQVGVAVLGLGEPVAQRFQAAQRVFDQFGVDEPCGNGSVRVGTQPKGESTVPSGWGQQRHSASKTGVRTASSSVGGGTAAQMEDRL